jgi:Ca2+-binding RTX toxin-like protein
VLDQVVVGNRGFAGSKWAICLALLAAAVAMLTLGGRPASAAVGDLLRTLKPPSEAPGFTNGCSIGLAFDGTNLYYDRCNDPNIYVATTTDADSDGDAELVRQFDTGIPELPNAMAFDALRNGLWIGTQRADANGDMPIYFYDFATNSASVRFVVPDDLVNPATGNTFVGFRFIDGLAFDAGDPATAADDAIWFSDDVNPNLGKFDLAGSLIQGYDARTVDPSMSSLSGHAVGGPLLYLANNGGGQVFRTDKSANPLGTGQPFAAAAERLEDMECDNVSFPVDAIWIRHTPQGVPADDLFTANEIEAGTCVLGGGPPVPQPPTPGVDVDCEGRIININGRTFQGDDTNEAIQGTPDRDLLRGGGGDDAIDGLPGDDCINGQAGNDAMLGADGADTVRGEAGSDAAEGGAGNDDIDGGTDADALEGGSDNDRVIGRGSDDRVKGDSGDDRTQGSGGNDRVNGDGGKDTSRGGTGDDRVTGGPGKDKVQSQGGEDRVSGGDGKDNIRAGGGNDEVDSADGFPDQVKCGLGFDEAVVDDEDKVNDDCNEVTVKQGDR